jgi:rhamnose transport system substrate-binding protein
MTRFVGAGRWSRGRQLSTPQYSKTKLVKVAHPDDDAQTSFQQPQGLLQAYPNLKGIISPTVRAVRPGQARLPGRLRGGRAGVRAGRSA